MDGYAKEDFLIYEITEEKLPDLVDFLVWKKKKAKRRIPDFDRLALWIVFDAWQKHKGVLYFHGGENTVL